MQWSDLIKACASGSLPKVKTEKGTIGQVSVIKANDRYRGIGVALPELNYDLFYHDSEDTDKRSRYMRDLSLVDSEQDEREANDIREDVIDMAMENKSFDEKMEYLKSTYFIIKK